MPPPRVHQEPGRDVVGLRGAADQRVALTRFERLGDDVGVVPRSVERGTRHEDNRFPTGQHLGETMAALSSSNIQRRDLTRLTAQGWHADTGVRMPPAKTMWSSAAQEPPVNAFNLVIVTGAPPPSGIFFKVPSR